MRKWSWVHWYGKWTLFLETWDGKPMGPMSGPVLQCGDIAPDEEQRQFIVDACNAAEQKAHWLRVWYGVPDADMQNHEIWPKSAPLSPRGHAVMEESPLTK